MAEELLVVLAAENVVLFSFHLTWFLGENWDIWGQFVEQKLPLSCSSKCNQIDNIGTSYDFDHTFTLIMTRKFNMDIKIKQT
jgi:hypothetical protein